MARWCEDWGGLIGCNPGLPGRFAGLGVPLSRPRSQSISPSLSCTPPPPTRYPLIIGAWSHADYLPRRWPPSTKNPRGCFLRGCVFRVVRPCGLKIQLSRLPLPMVPRRTANGETPWRSVLRRRHASKGPGVLPPDGSVGAGGWLQRFAKVFSCSLFVLLFGWVGSLSVNCYPRRCASPGFRPGATPDSVQGPFNPLQGLQLPGVDEISADLMGAAFNLVGASPWRVVSFRVIHRSCSFSW